MKVLENIKLLGLKARDKVTGYEGVITSISFDLYGCIMATVTPPIDKDGKKDSGLWFDVVRLEILDRRPVIELPAFLGAIDGLLESQKALSKSMVSKTPQPVTEGVTGPAEKPPAPH